MKSLQEIFANFLLICIAIFNPFLTCYEYNDFHMFGDFFIIKNYFHENYQSSIKLKSFDEKNPPYIYMTLIPALIPRYMRK